MDTSNPFQPPAANVNAPGAFVADRPSGVPPSVIAILGETRPWLRLLLGLFVTGMVLVSALVLGTGFLGWFVPYGRRSPPLVALLSLALVLAINGPPAVFLARSASAISRLQQGGGLADLEDALRSERNLWKYLGLLALGLVLLYAIIVVFVRTRH